jgi:long-subunit fatty acid transport protein
MRYTTEPPVGNKYSKNLNFKQNFEATTTIRLGGEFTVPLLNTQLRAGLIRQPSPLIYDTEKADRNYITAGCGILLDKQVKLDVAAVRGWWKKTGTDLSEDFSGITEKIIVDQVFATMSIRF